jgi:hypothetical protein
VIPGVKCLAAIYEGNGKTGVAGEVEVDIAREDVPKLVSLFALITAGGSQSVAARRFVSQDLRVVEEMSASASAGTEQSAGRLDLDVCDLERARHARAEGQDPA